MLASVAQVKRVDVLSISLRLRSNLTQACGRFALSVSPLLQSWLKETLAIIERCASASNGRQLPQKTKRAPLQPTPSEKVNTMSSDRCQYSTGLDLREGFLFAAIFLVWMSSVGALSVMCGGAQ